MIKHDTNLWPGYNLWPGWHENVFLMMLIPKVELFVSNPSALQLVWGGAGAKDGSGAIAGRALRRPRYWVGCLESARGTRHLAT